VFGALLATPVDSRDDAEQWHPAYGGAVPRGRLRAGSRSFWRTFATARGEYVGSAAFDETHAGVGGAGRLSVELFTSGVGVEPRGLFLGAYAIGLYIEAGARDMANGVSVFQAGAGLTFRTRSCSRCDPLPGSRATTSSSELDSRWRSASEQRSDMSRAPNRQHAASSLFVRPTTRSLNSRTWPPSAWRRLGSRSIAKCSATRTGNVRQRSRSRPGPGRR